MGKKRIIKADENQEPKIDGEVKDVTKNDEIETNTDKIKTSGKKRFDSGLLHVRSTYNNTVLVLTDK
ncbi:MAG: hypothetical protein UR80_C0017G0009, partial [Parcubacteria group bacterium GW2011_GWB1_35_5]